MHRMVAAALIGRDLDKSEEVHHLDADRKNCHFLNLMVLGQKDHSWVSSRQAWFMREKDKREKRDWDEFMSEKDTEFRDEVDALLGCQIVDFLVFFEVLIVLGGPNRP